MLEKYKQYLEHKDTFWKLAKQYQFNTLNIIELSLKNLDEFTTRNSIGLRLIGLVENKGSDELELTNAARSFLANADKQAVIDEQLLKIYLDSFVNPHLQLPVFPLLSLLSILQKLDYVTFEEYRLFVCWQYSKYDLQMCIELISEYRRASDEQKDLVRVIHENKTSELRVRDFNDGIYRLFKILLLSSYFDETGIRYQKILTRNSTPEIYESVIQTILDRYSGASDYKPFLQTYGEHIKDKPSHSAIIDSIENLSNDERKILRKTIKERNELPDIVDVIIGKIEPTILASVEVAGTNEKSRSKPFKIDYGAKGERNRLLGLHAEKIVLRYEYEKLQHAGRRDLMAKIDHCSTEDDSLGYDILSFDATGTPLHIEVKAVRGTPTTVSFYISAKELDLAKNDPNYALYLVLDYRTKAPKIWQCPDIFSTTNDAIKLEPKSYLVTISVAKPAP